MLEIVMAGGVLMLPIILCSIVAMAICLERLWVLRRSRVLPTAVITRAKQLLCSDTIGEQKIDALRRDSVLGELLSVALTKRRHTRESIIAAVEDRGRQVAHRLQRYMNALGTVAAITPLLGLLGTVVGMISVFTRITGAGVGNAGELAGGISTALITTAAGLSVAIPALVMHRYLRSRIDGLVLDLEQQTLSVVDEIDRVPAPASPAFAHPQAERQHSRIDAARARNLAGIGG